MVIRKLNLKLIRDIWFSPWLFLGIVLMVASGIALFDATYLSYYNLGHSYHFSYRKLNMADFTIEVQSAPEEVVDRIRRIPGVKAVEGRVFEELEIEQDLATRRVLGRILSIPDRGLPAVNTPRIVRGRLPAPGSSRELLLEYSFAQYHGYKPGDAIYPVVDDDKIRFRVAGIFKSPEYIVVVQSRDNPTPTPKQLGVMFMRKEIVDRLFGTSGAVNQVAVTIMPGVRRARVMRDAEKLLRPYGADEPVPQEQQPSYEMLELDLRALRNLSIFFPVLFLSIASLSIYNLLSRMIHAQKAQIGFMRAVGYGRKAVLGHYCTFAALIGLIGSGVGSILGYRMARSLTDLYVTNVSVPYEDIQPRFEVMAVGVVVSFIVTLLAGLIPARTASKMTPAEAIRIDVPTVSRMPVMENFMPWLRRLSYTWRLPLRNLLRRPKRTISTILGIASAITLILVSSGLIDSSRAAIDFYFVHLQKYNVAVMFAHPRTESALGQVRKWKGVQRVEPLLQVPVKVTYRGREKVTIIFGVDPNTRLLNPTAYDGARISVPRTGVSMGDPLMRRLGLSLGQTVTFTLPKKTVPELAPPGMEIPGAAPGYRRQVLSRSRGLQEVKFRKQVRIMRRTYQPIGNALMMNIGEVRRLFGPALELPPNAINGVLVLTDPRYEKEVTRRMYDLPGAAMVVSMQDSRQEIDEAMKTFNTFVNIMLGFAIALAFVIISNATTMNILERTREMASMRALGVGIWQIGAMVTIENLSAWVAGTVLGLPVGRWLADYFVKLYISEAFHMQTVIFPKTYAWTILGILITVLISQLPGIRYLARLDLASATKEIGG